SPYSHPSSSLLASALAEPLALRPVVGFLLVAPFAGTHFDLLPAADHRVHGLHLLRGALPVAAAAGRALAGLHDQLFLLAHCRFQPRQESLEIAQRADRGAIFGALAEGAHVLAVIGAQFGQA